MHVTKAGAGGAALAGSIDCPGCQVLLETQRIPPPADKHGDYASGTVTMGGAEQQQWGTQLSPCIYPELVPPPCPTLNL